MVGVSSEKEPDWQDLMSLSKLIPRVCHNVNRVCYVDGGLVKDPVLDITPTYLTTHVLATVRQADHLVNQVYSSCYLFYLILILSGCDLLRSVVQNRGCGRCPKQKLKLLQKLGL